MYTLFRGLCKYVSKKDEYSVLILGLDDAGKTTYLEQTKTKFNKDYKSMPLNKITSTVGLNIGQIFVEGIVIKFWDLGGQTELQSLWDKYYLESHGIIFVVDSSEPDRFDEAKAAFDAMIKNKALEGLPLLILANKQDLDGAFPVSEVKQVFQESAHLIGQRDCSMRGASALLGNPSVYLVTNPVCDDNEKTWVDPVLWPLSRTGKAKRLDGVDDGIRWMAQKVRKNSCVRPPNTDDQGF